MDENYNQVCVMDENSELAKKYESYEHEMEMISETTDKVVGVLAVTGAIAIGGLAVFGIGKLAIKINEKITDKIEKKILEKKEKKTEA